MSEGPLGVGQWLWSAARDPNGRRPWRQHEWTQSISPGRGMSVQGVRDLLLDAFPYSGLQSSESDTTPRIFHGECVIHWMLAPSGGSSRPSGACHHTVPTVTQDGRDLQPRSVAPRGASQEMLEQYLPAFRAFGQMPSSKKEKACCLSALPPRHCCVTTRASNLWKQSPYDIVLTAIRSIVLP